MFIGEIMLEELNYEDIEKLDFLALRNKFLEKFEGIKNED